jgi:pantoate--beta-alanine ligase
VPEVTMKIAQTVLQLRQFIGSLKISGHRTGFVPTMGALHEGHISLVNICKKENEITVVSIFVNPNQFNDKKDLENYPCMPEKDIKLLEEAGCDVVFMPGVAEIYPEPDTRSFDFGLLGEVMEGKHRPGHFNGVAQVVTRLFEIVKPDRAYFGLKDFQQLAIIKKVTKDFNLPVEIIPCPIVRESDGLAMSSRNTLLTPDERSHAARIYATLFRAREMAPDSSPDEIRKFVTGRINEDPYLQTEYFEIADDTTLQPIESWDQAGGKIGCVAVKVGKVRLIDNVNFSS